MKRVLYFMKKAMKSYFETYARMMSPMYDIYR